MEQWEMRGLGNLHRRLLLSDQGLPMSTASELLEAILKVFDCDGGLLCAIQVTRDLFSSEYTAEDVVVESSIVGVNESFLVIPG